VAATLFSVFRERRPSILDANSQSRGRVTPGTANIFNRGTREGQMCIARSSCRGRSADFGQHSL
jgi:hypothetical protein